MALLTTKEVAALLRVNEDTVRRLIRQGKLPAYCVGRRKRIDLSLLRKTLENGEFNHATFNH
jgi:excisionase family DNA binding protein